jgi:hypothetical protein
LHKSAKTGGDRGVNRIESKNMKIVKIERGDAESESRT